MRWEQFEKEMPELAALAKRLLWHESQKNNFAFLATEGAGGRLRLHPICPTFSEGGLYHVAEGKTPKKRDLLNDGRYAMHALLNPGGEPGSQFYVYGRAVLANDPENRAKVESTYQGWKFSEDETVFELLLERVLHTDYVDGTGYIHTKWRAGGTS
ncbi:MAG: hypothetical protein WEB00_07970 [Dehalococcoidia bacterium]